MLSLRPSNWSCGDDHSNILRQDYNLHPRISDLDAHRPGFSDSTRCTSRVTYRTQALVM